MSNTAPFSATTSLPDKVMVPPTAVHSPMVWAVLFR